MALASIAQLLVLSLQLLLFKIMFCSIQLSEWEWTKILILSSFIKCIYKDNINAKKKETKKVIAKEMREKEEWEEKNSDKKESYSRDGWENNCGAYEREERKIR